MGEGTYLDNSVSAQPSKETIAEMIPWLGERFGALESPHRVGQVGWSVVRESLGAIHALLDADKEDSFVFTSSGEEAINQVMLGMFFTYIQESGRNHIILSSADEVAHLSSMKRMEELGCSYKIVPPGRDGAVSVKALEAAITPRTILMSLGAAHGLTGVVNPVDEIASLCHERAIFFHLDVTHAIGRVPLNLNHPGLSFVTFRGEPLHAPQGTGGLLLKKAVRTAPLILGGGEQSGLRGGAFSLALLSGLGVAAKTLSEAKDYLSTEIARIRVFFEDEVLASIPGSEVLFLDTVRLPHVTTIAFPGVASEVLLYHLNSLDVFASMGGGPFLPLSATLIESGFPPEKALSALSFSFSRYSTEDDAQAAAQALKKSVEKLRGLSRYFTGV
ncbi:cysteine desulfurase family protein [Estrella lausannensis]|uniref:Cysteine desulfurase n=1 Tax=Estrella lausannensis TaxID=483423 RepID=A0A0H5DQX1_9BACT|nr:aminotransferase class V-fold PLP-dependent enzyme [Estrella lausannensis]CRX38962.1 cysteine desulfurase [Estrella lausannensis]